MTERIITYAQALHEATAQEMRQDPSVILFGMGVDDFKGTWGTTKDLHMEFGRNRVFDTPLSEDAMTGVAIGAALAGLKPIHVHIRMDFVMLAMNQLINIAAKARAMYGGAVKLPIVVRSVIGRSWGQGAQHSQGLHSFFMHVPGLKVVAPSTPYDAKGCLTQAIRDPNPVMFIEQRMLHFQKSHVPEEPYVVPFGRARVLRSGSDVTMVGISYMALECLRAARHLAEVGIDAEVIDPVSLSPLDAETIVASARKTGRLLAVDTAWTNCGAAAEILARVVEGLQDERPIRVLRMGYEPVVCPPSRPLEQLYYPSPQTIAARAYAMVHADASPWIPTTELAPEIVEFKGPF